MKFVQWVLKVYSNEDFTRWKGKKSWNLKAGALFHESAPYWKSTLKRPLAKKLEGVCRSKCKFQLPEPGTGLGYQWSPSSPPPAHPWFSKCRTRDGRTGRTLAKYVCKRAGTVENFAGASLHELYWVSVHVPHFPLLFSSLFDTYNII